MPPPLVIMIAGLAGLVGSAAWLRHWLSVDEKTIREMRRVSRHRIADVPGGELVRIVGMVREGARTMEAPLSGRICVGYRIRGVVEKTVPDVFHEERCHDFIVEDESGRAIVETARVHAVLAFDRDEYSSGLAGAPSRRKRKLLRRHGHTSFGMFGIVKKSRCREAALVPGETVVVVGLARWEHDPDVLVDHEVGGGYRVSARKMRLVIEAPDGEAVRVTDEPHAWLRDRGFSDPPRPS